jgi:hypothetical protein
MHPSSVSSYRSCSDRLQAVGAQKGMMFATTGYRRGALEYVAVHGIALVTVAEAARASKPVPRCPRCTTCRGFRGYVIWIRALTSEGNEQFTLLDTGRPEVVREAFREAV